MSNFTSRNLLICVVPAVIVLASVYWFRKKKKFKTNLQSLPDVQTISGEECEKLDSLAECSTDSADTLSDASSFASPESSEKSLRTKSFPLINSTDNIVKDDSFCSNTPITLLSNHVEMNSCKTSPSSNKSESPLHIAENLQPHNGLNIIKPADSDSDNNKSEVGNAVYDSSSIDSEMVEKCNLLPDLKRASLDKVTKIDVNEHLSNAIHEEESAEEMFSRLMKVPNFNQASMDINKALEEMLSFSPSNVHIVENGISHSNDSNESAALFQASEIKLQTIETDSNDSHSSVLDENSLSYVSDDSERQVVELKNKCSLLSDFDESLLSSLCDELDKSNSLSPPMATFKSLSGFGLGDGVIVEEKISEIKENVNFSQASGLEWESTDNSTTLNETQILVQDQCSNFVHVKDVTVQNESEQILETGNSLDNNTTQSFPIRPNYLSEPNCSAASQMESFEETTVSCDSSANECKSVSLFSVKSSLKSSIPVSDAISQDCNDICDLLRNPSPIMDGTNVLTQAVDKLVNGEESDISAAVEAKPKTSEPQITEMNISEHLSGQTVSTLPELGNSSESGWEMQDSQSDALRQSKSDDTGLAGSKVPENSSGQYVYEFELPQELCGRLIGKHGKHVKSIKDRSHANVYIKRHPYDPQLKIVVVEGDRSDVNDALEIIRRKYPPSRYPTVTLVKTNMISSNNVLPESLQLHIPEGASCDVILSSLVSAGHFFLQQPTHPTYPSLSTLDQCMINCYSQGGTPLLPHPVEAGVICAAPVLSGWYRAQVIYVYENEIECELKFVDYGGFSQAPTSSLRQIRSDFMSLPFQASECYLANVRPVDPVEGWSAEATATFEELAQGQILQALLVEYATDGIPCVHLYRVQGISNMFINKELVERGLAVWVNNSHWDPH